MKKFIIFACITSGMMQEAEQSASFFYTLDTGVKIVYYGVGMKNIRS